MDEAISVIREEGMSVVFVLDKICVLATEQTYGAKEIVVLYANKM